MTRKRKTRNGLIKLFFGKTKSGKSWLAEQLLKNRSKAVVYDFARCFTEGTIIEDFSISHLSKLLQTYGGKSRSNKKFKLIFRKPSNMTHQDAVDLVALFAKKLGESYGSRALKEGDELVLVVDEADKCVSKKDADKVRMAVQAGRHDNLSTWAISQRPMNLHPDFRDNASEIYAFKLAVPDSFYKNIFTKKHLEGLKDSPKHSHLFWNDEGVIQAVNAKGVAKDIA